MKRVLTALMLLLCANVKAAGIESYLNIKTAGNPAATAKLTWRKTSNNHWQLTEHNHKLDIQVSKQANSYSYKIVARADVHFNLQNIYPTNFNYQNTEFLMPGIWYKKNQNSSADAPSVNEATSWSFREDRLSTPLTGLFNQQSQSAITITRLDNIKQDSVAVPGVGEMILSAHSDLGSLGFGEVNNKAYLQFGYPYAETPKTYVRKLTLAPESMAFVSINKGQTIELNYAIEKTKVSDFSSFVKQSWQYSIDTFQPQPVKTALPTEIVKRQLTKYFKQSYLHEKELAGFSGVHLRTDIVEKKNLFEVGFVGRVLLNAFNALEYAEQVQDQQLIEMSESIFNSYLQDGFNQQGFFREVVNFDHPAEHLARTMSIRRQSEGIYAALLYMNYRKQQGHNMRKWDAKIHTLLEQLAKLQTADGAFPRKFTPQAEIIDGAGGSSPSAVLAYVMAYKYFNEEKYLNVARHTTEYLATHIVEPAEYVSSTLDANCVDKEAAFYTAMALYYLALVTDGNEQNKYIALLEQANYFVMSWYYTWDVPFAKGQMLGDVGFKTRGWGNVSVENNHVDVFIFGYLDVLYWLADKNGDKRLTAFAQVIESSMKSQLLPRQGHMFNIGKEGYYPEVVQHTNWDYGHFGKGFYNDIFAPGWVVASLWEMLTPNRAEQFLRNAKH
ncbi:hypothetical protein [Catenovulum adriaticum]|uniref:Uncharacterized protein n=1 Tax=Catenovulum adriaticum TaxID=2984846 RepID=A0ABY7ARA6_9ALTE|nr:hypothetical protein [Catenovulum sp. TS8]WAJ71783.1 hypothetical protein OLW01_15710 [Catenovulum sp. TS8]